MFAFSFGFRMTKKVDSLCCVGIIIDIHDQISWLTIHNTT